MIGEAQVVNGNLEPALRALRNSFEANRRFISRAAEFETPGQRRRRRRHLKRMSENAADAAREAEAERRRIQRLHASRAALISSQP